jgi:hypothetical protein
MRRAGPCWPDDSTTARISSADLNGRTPSLGNAMLDASIAVWD